MEIAILCIGNELMLDEGLGPRIARELLATYEFPESVHVFDMGTMGMSIIPILKEHDFVLTVDAVDNTGQKPGTVFRFNPDDIAPNTVLSSLHDLRFIDVLNAAELLGYKPEGHCIGVQVLNMDPEDLTIGLTEPVEAAVPLVMFAIEQVLEEKGITLALKEGAISPRALLGDPDA